MLNNLLIMFILNHLYFIYKITFGIATYEIGFQFDGLINFRYIALYFRTFLTVHFKFTVSVIALLYIFCFFAKKKPF